MFRKSLKFGTALLGLAAVIAGPAYGEETFKLGFLGGLTGYLAPYDQPSLDGLAFGVEEINKKGGLQGKFKIEGLPVGDHTFTVWQESSGYIDRAFKVSVKQYDWMVGVGDMGVNGHSGLVVREKKTGYLWLLPGTTTGFAPRVFLGQGFKGYDLAG